ncbi:MAG TPA: NAD(P)/FAD-dependent oxidoreductase [Chitinispirillaceae bacterium]|nr:NAD(P)/FAD-dependent oxidoreductase [Chitinispirillaceae bacterium]
MADFDVAVIGSGIAGLTCGAFLAKQGMKVLVLEKHYQIGGYTHSFKRKSYHFESAVHSVPFGNNGLIMHLLKQLGVEQLIKPVELPSMYHSQWTDFSFTMPVWYDDIKTKLQSDFLNQKEQINRLFDDMHFIYDEFITPIIHGSLKETGGYRDFISRHQNRSYKEYLNSFLSDPNLLRAFYSQWPYGSNPPSKAPVAFYVLMFIVHAIEGSHYLEGGFYTLADALASVIKSNGGQIRTKSTVTGLKNQGLSVTELTLDTGEVISANLFVSNISPYLLHNQLIAADARNKIWLRRLNNLKPSFSAVALYLGLKSNISDMIPNNIHFCFSNSDDDRIYERIITNGSSDIDHLLFLHPKCNENAQTLTILSYIQQSFSSDWKQDKKILAKKMLSEAEIFFPGLNQQIELIEIGSPATFQRYTGNTNGALYGFENTKHIYGEAKIPSTTHLSNLYQTGHWGKPGGGIWNSMYNGYVTSLLISQNQ